MNNVPFATAYPHIAEWVRGAGYVELGYTGFGPPAFVRALDEGGTVYEGKPEYGTIDEALQDLDHGIGRWIAETG